MERASRHDRHHSSRAAAGGRQGRPPAYADRSAGCRSASGADDWQSRHSGSSSPPLMLAPLPPRANGWQHPSASQSPIGRLPSRTLSPRRPRPHLALQLPGETDDVAALVEVDRDQFGMAPRRSRQLRAPQQRATVAHRAVRRASPPSASSKKQADARRRSSRARSEAACRAPRGRHEAQPAREPLGDAHRLGREPPRHTVATGALGAQVGPHPALRVDDVAMAIAHQEADAAAELAWHRSDLVREEPSRSIRRRHRVVGAPDHRLVEPAVAEHPQAAAGRDRLRLRSPSKSSSCAVSAVGRSTRLSSSVSRIASIVVTRGRDATSSGEHA